MSDMCPYCGELVRTKGSLTAYHDLPQSLGISCPGSMEYARCAESDARPLWTGEPNRRFTG